MQYETKVILAAVAQLMVRAEDLEDAYEALAEMANAEGVFLKPFSEVRKNHIARD